MFKNAMPVWLKDRSDEINIAAAFTETTGSLKGAQAYITACSFYRLYVNGTFVAFGPARTAKGYARVDIIPLSEYDAGETNRIRIEVVAYNCRSLSTCLGSGFLVAEIRRGDDVLCFTGRDFKAFLMKEKEQYVPRLSVQRHFMEIWNYTKQEEPCETEITENIPKYLKRTTPYPLYRDASVSKASTVGEFSDSGKETEKTYYSWQSPTYWRSFEDKDIAFQPFRFLLRQTQTPKSKELPLPITLKAGEYAVFDMSLIECGFLRLNVSASGETDAVIGFSEYCDGEKFTFPSTNMHRAVEVVFCDGFGGEWQSFEPYTVRFGIVAVKSGTLTVTSFGVKTYERDMSEVKTESFESPVHRKIYNAALRTFAHNAVDIYMDCPSRERAGWLCDSYFTAPVEKYLFGEVPVEDDFLENFRLSRDPHLAGGLLPMCYPSDLRVYESGATEHIPQWCMWYVLELKEYLTERNPSADRELYRDSIEGLLDYFVPFENEYGLLEDLPGWNFVEWSDANKWTKNVNYPTNFLYAATLDAAYALYGKRSYKEKAERVRKKAAELSFDGEYFTDNAERDENGVLKNTGNTSEACQYYACLFGGIDIDQAKYAKYKENLLSGCQGIEKTGRHFTPVNAFIGLYLRIKTLLMLGEYHLLLDNIEEFFGGMADKTGTLWEHRKASGSLDHGFASYAAYAMCEALKHLK